MLVRHPADYRTLLWTFGFVPLVAWFQLVRPELGWALFPCSMYLAVSCAVIAHNHMHRPTMRGKFANQFFSGFISIVYGYPVFAWMPTHNLNHHRFVNRPGDATITWRITNRHNALVAGTYFFVSAYHQGRWIKDFIRQARRRNPALFRKILLQYAITYGGHLALLAAAVALHGPKHGSFVYFRGFFVPAFFALWTVMLFNYTQHVHTDPWSKRNHSRNFTGKLLNVLLFGNGYHTVHHDDAQLHWSEAAAAHARIAHEIDPRLCHRSMWWFFFRQHILALFVPSLGTVQIGRSPWDVGDGEGRPDAPEEIELQTLQTAGGQIGCAPHAVRLTSHILPSTRKQCAAFPPRVAGAQKRRGTMPFFAFTDEFHEVVRRWDGTIGAPSLENRKIERIVVYRNPFVEKVLASSHPILPGVWFGGFIAYGAWLAVANSRGIPLGIGVYAAGVLSFSLLEYLLHRFLFHLPIGESYGSKVRLFLMHGLHHEFPNDRYRLVAPPLMSWPIALLVAVGLQLALPTELAWISFGGVTLGYLAYDWIHYATHHFRSPKSRLMKVLRRAHAVHHYKLYHLNMGISSPLWDWVFGTFAWSEDTVRAAMAETRLVEAEADRAAQQQRPPHRTT